MDLLFEDLVILMYVVIRGSFLMILKKIIRYLKLNIFFVCRNKRDF